MRVAGTGLGFGEDQQMLKLFILVQLAFLIWGKPLLLPLADKLPYPSPRGFGGLKGDQSLGGNLASEKLNHFVGSAHEAMIPSAAGTQDAIPPWPAGGCGVWSPAFRRPVEETRARFGGLPASPPKGGTPNLVLAERERQWDGH